MAPITRSQTAPSRELEAREQASANNKGELRLVGLPAEIRKMIYDCLLPNRITCHKPVCRFCLGRCGGPHFYQWVWQRDGEQLRACLNLIATCKGLRDEVGAFLMDTIRFRAVKPYDLASFIVDFPTLKPKLGHVRMSAYYIAHQPHAERQAVVASLARLEHLDSLRLTGLHRYRGIGSGALVLDRVYLKLLKSIKRKCPRLVRIEVTLDQLHVLDVRLSSKSVKPKINAGSLDLNEEAKKRKHEIRQARYKNMRGLEQQSVSVSQQAQEATDEDTSAASLLNILVTGAFVNQLLTTVN